MKTWLKTMTALTLACMLSACGTMDTQERRMATGAMV